MSSSTILFFASGVVGLLSAYLGYRRGKNPLYWFLIGFLFGLLGICFIFFVPKKRAKTASASQQPQIRLNGPVDKFWYYVNEAREQIGPMSYEAFLSAYKEKKISKDNLVWHEELTEWKPLEILVSELTKKP